MKHIIKKTGKKTAISLILAAAAAVYAFVPMFRLALNLNAGGPYAAVAQAAERFGHFSYWEGFHTHDSETSAVHHGSEKERKKAERTCCHA